LQETARLKECLQAHKGLLRLPLIKGFVGPNPLNLEQQQIKQMMEMKAHGN
jgi:hypothetical protein